MAFVSMASVLEALKAITMGNKKVPLMILASMAATMDEPMVTKRLQEMVPSRAPHF